jgi:hypothetical protein
VDTTKFLNLAFGIIKICLPEIRQAGNKKNIIPKLLDNSALIRKASVLSQVTFHLGSGGNTLSRRTLAMVKENENWKIAHLHASSVSENKN